MLIKYLLDIPTPSHVINLDKIEANLNVLEQLCKKTNLILLFALKGFSNPQILRHFIQHFDGLSASSLSEARLAKELTALPVHTFSPSYCDKTFSSICSFSDCIIFNSISQWEQFGTTAIAKKINCGIRINPEYSEIKKFAINPCHSASRFGVHAKDLEKIDFSKIKGIHFHSMCEQYSDTFRNTLTVIEKEFGTYLHQAEWLNIGGGQLFCDEAYNLHECIELINQMQDKYKLKIIAEPCETVVSDAGYFVATITDIVFNNVYTAILDASAICHLPDIVHSPYRCEVMNAAKPNVKKYTYRLAGATCYAGDIFGDYSFDTPLDIGSKIVFCDTAPYSMVKSNIFNGISLPSYISIGAKHGCCIEKNYDYDTFLSLL